MDRPLDTMARLRLRLRRVLVIAAPVAALATLLVLLPGWIRPSLARARIRTATVTVGALDQVITAAGTVVPEIERVLSTPVDARLLRVLKRPGATVHTGDPIVELDTSESRLAYEKLRTDVEISDNQRAQAIAALEKALADLDGRIDRATLQLESLQAKAASARELSSQGLLSREGLRDAELATAQATLELAQLRAERVQAQRSTDLQTAGLALQRTALERGASEARRVLHLATATADRDGVLTWVVTQEGSLVHRGEVVARLADLTSFRVDATLPDLHRQEIRVGMPVVVAVNDERLGGRVSEIEPTVQDGVVRFTIALENPSDPSLRSNLRVDANLVIDHRTRTRKVKLGPFADGTGAHGQVFVVRGDRAYRTDVDFGLRSYDDVEIRSGLAEGDDVILSDMKDYLHLKEIGIR